MVQARDVVEAELAAMEADGARAHVWFAPMARMMRAIADHVDGDHAPAEIDPPESGEDTRDGAENGTAVDE